MQLLAGATPLSKGSSFYLCPNQYVGIDQAARLGSKAISKLGLLCCQALRLVFLRWGPVGRKACGSGVAVQGIEEGSFPLLGCY